MQTKSINKIFRLFLVFAALFLYNILSASPSTKSLNGLVERRIPWLKGKVEFIIDKKTDQHYFTLETVNNKLRIAASTTNEAAFGLNWYLKYYCHQSISHLGDNIVPLDTLPIITKSVKITTEMPIRYALNYCTYNYSYSFYKWQDWERELDWMALNGVNTMLVAVGLEIVWDKVLQEFGYTKNERQAYIPGPAYNAWWLMGNLEGTGGSSSEDQLHMREALLKKILSRMEEFGIDPVFPGFYGTVPHDFADKKKAKVIRQGNWGAFKRPDILDVQDPYFKQVAKSYYTTIQKLYGKNIKYFSGDPFHEGGISTGVDLGLTGKAIQEQMQQYFPNSIWVLQGWQSNPKKALIAQTNKTKLLVQELFGENTNNWETRKAYDSTPFIWGIVNNFGERPGLNGKLERFVNEVNRAKNSPFKSYLKGVGILPEGIFNNPVSYDLVLELPWHEEKIDVKNWVKSYVLSRYGQADSNIVAAWDIFLQTIYSNPGHQEGPPENILCARPGLDVTSVSTWSNIKKGYDTVLFAKGVELFASSFDKFKGKETYNRDLIQFAGQVISNRSDNIYSLLKNAYAEKDVSAFASLSTLFLHQHDLLDNLYKTDSETLLSTYAPKAYTYFDNQADKVNNLENAIRLVTYWGSDNRDADDLHEYAYKEWSGLILPYYKERWQLYFKNVLASMRNNSKIENIDFFVWERKWVADYCKNFPSSVRQTSNKDQLWESVQSVLNN